MSVESGFNRDFLDILHHLDEAGAEFLVVGAHAMALHGVPRATGDRRIDLLTEVSGLDFDEAWASRTPHEIGTLTVFFLGRGALIKNKQAAGRPKDQLDLELLKKAEQ